MSISDLAYPQVRYARPAVRTVVCALQFNPILKIVQEPPADFQEHVRGVFPRFSRADSVELQLAVGEGPPLSALRRAAAWRFQTEDEHWTAALSTESVSLETAAYQTFPNFEQKLEVLYGALRAVYEVDHFVRIGLRYVNVFEAPRFPGGWIARLNPALLGPMADQRIGENVVDCKQVFTISDGDWVINVRHGREGNDYLLDIDHATQVAGALDEVAAKLRSFNDRAYQIFRWAITDRLHDEMEPGPHE